MEATSLMASHHREKAQGNTGQSVEELDTGFQLLLLLNSIDLQIMHSSVKQLGRAVRLTPESVQVR